MIKVVNLFYNYIISIFDYLKVLFTDNESYFTEKEITQFFKLHKVIHYTALILHSASVELIEKNI